MTRNNEGGISAAGRNFPDFLKQAAGILISLLVLGSLPTVRWAGNEGLWAMVMGCGVSLVGSAVGTVPLLTSRGRTQVETLPSLIGSIVLRMAVVIALATAVAFSGLFANKPLLIWVAISHAGLLVADTVFARREVVFRKQSLARDRVRLKSEPARRDRTEDR